MAKRLVRYSRLARAIHMINLVAFFIFIYTGLAFISPTFNILADVVGGFDVTRMLHRLAAAVFILIPILAIIMNIDGFKEFMKETFQWSKEDTKWMIRFPLYLFRPSTKMPKTETKGSAGQRLVAFFLIGGALWQTITGFMLVFRPAFSKSMIITATLFHDIGFFVLGVLIIGHAYFGLGLFRPYRGISKGMLGDGTVDSNLANKLWPEWASKNKVVEK